jgi:pyruvate dehydrogenase E2 component (dihydrolipoamide acetyltransferase)
MPIQITMPQLSDTMIEGTVVKWHKKEGDKVKAGEEIVDVETDKATMPFEAAEAGTLAHIAVQEGQRAPVGAVIAVLATGKENAADVKKSAGAASGAGTTAAPAPAATAAPATAAKGGGTGNNGGNSGKARLAGRSPGHERVPPPAAHHGAVQTMEGASVGEMHEPEEAGHGATRGAATAVPPLQGRGTGGDGNGHGERIFASPLARRVAADRNIDLSQLAGKGSGPGGRIVQRDVLAVSDRAPAPDKGAAEPAPATAAATQAPELPARVPRGEKEVVPLTKMRSAIAAGLQRSKQSIPHFYETIDIDVEELSALRGRLNEQLKAENVKLSVSDFVTKAVAAALLRHPAVNATFDEKKGEITRHGDVNLGIAVAVPDGLIVPVLRGVDPMGLREIRVRSAELVKRAQALRLKQDEMRGATFTISNLGMYGVREFAAIINPPEVGILAVGAAEPRAVVRGGQVVARTVMTVTLSADHRAVDGAVAAQFLRTLKALLEEPGMMLV